MIQHGCTEIALECIQLYFSLGPPTTQFLIRAHLCGAVATAPKNCSEEVKENHSIALCPPKSSPMILQYIYSCFVYCP